MFRKSSITQVLNNTTIDWTETIYLRDSRIKHCFYHTQIKWRSKQDKCFFIRITSTTSHLLRGCLKCFYFPQSVLKANAKDHIFGLFFETELRAFKNICLLYFCTAAINKIDKLGKKPFISIIINQMRFMEVFI